ncbi:MAG: hypothetical protein QM704_06725 [Anaeromyxobacteraceae bacterium]
MALVTAGIAAASVVYVLVAPRWYQVQATLVPARSQRSGGSGIASLLGGDLASLAGGLEAATGGGADVQRIAAVLKSDTVTDAVIGKFALKERYSAKYLESAREVLWRRCGVKTLPKPGLVQIACEDKDPQFVKQMVEFFVEKGNEVFSRVNVSSATEEARFLERRVTDLRKQAADSAQAMREFQEKYKIVDLETQTRAVVSAVAGLQTQRINRQLELDFARRFASADESTLRQLRSQIAVVDGQLAELQAAEAASQTTPRSLMPPALEVPRLREQFESLYRDRKVSEATLVFALERLESAKANEARDVSTFMVLDPPALPDRHSRPKRTLTVVGMTVLGGLIAFAWEWRRRGGLRLAPLVDALIGPPASADQPPRSS